MSEYYTNFQHFWNRIMGPHLETIIPVLFIFIGITWLIATYRTGKFRFLPALAIARVTVLDSIGRMEVIILLAIGMMIVGINGIIPNTPAGSKVFKQWTDTEYFQERLNELTGLSNYSDFEIDGWQEGVSLQFSVAEDEISPLSVVDTEPDVDPPDGVTVDEPENGTTGEITPAYTRSRAAELEAELRQQTLDGWIWQAAFLIADVFVALIGFILAMVVLPNEMNRGVILSILPKPVSREEYVFGKAMGIWLIVSGCFLIIMLELWGIRAVVDVLHGQSPWDFHMFEAICLFPLKYATLILIIMGLTLRIPEVAAGILGVTLFLGGHFSDRLYEMATDPEGNPIVGFGLRFAYWLLPHLTPVTFGIIDPIQTLITNWDERWGWIWQISIYNFILLWLLGWLFRRRSL